MAKRNTPELILQTSLALFNELGESNVSTNHIADEANISPGNLYYHFKSKQDIVLTLFKRFAAQLHPIIDVPSSLALQPEDLWFQLHLSFELKSQYRFLYRNLTDLSAAIPDLGRAFKGLIRLERKAAFDLISSLEKSGSMRLGRNEKELLINNLMLALVYWINYAEMFEDDGLENGKVQVTAIAGVLQMILPYMMGKHRKELELLMSNYLSTDRWH